MQMPLKMHAFCFQPNNHIITKFYPPFLLPTKNCHEKLLKGEKGRPIFSNNTKKNYSKGLHLKQHISRKIYMVSYYLVLHSEA